MPPLLQPMPKLLLIPLLQPATPLLPMLPRLLLTPPPWLPTLPTPP